MPKALPPPVATHFETYGAPPTSRRELPRPPPACRLTQRASREGTGESLPAEGGSSPLGRPAVAGTHPMRLIRRQTRFYAGNVLDK